MNFNFHFYIAVYALYRRQFPFPPDSPCTFTGKGLSNSVEIIAFQPGRTNVNILAAAMQLLPAFIA
jgi:hypothetical protein